MSRPGPDAWPRYADADVVAARPPKAGVDPRRPYAFLVEQETTATGQVEPVATVFLTNRECPFRCLMCDLWQHTTDETVTPGLIPAQIEYALDRLPPARHIKLYNSGNFFDRKAIPPGDHAAIADRVRGFETVIVENHPRLCDEACLRFRDRLAGRLEVAMGLETIHPDVWPRLNKRMSPEDFARAAGFLRAAGIDVRAFLLIRPPFLSDADGVEWALRSLAYAFDAGAQCAALIPTRGGNGIMERLASEGWYAPPSARAIETALAEGLRMGQGRVFVDLWDADRFFPCAACRPARLARLREMNLSQRILPATTCDVCGEVAGA